MSRSGRSFPAPSRKPHPPFSTPILGRLGLLGAVLLLGLLLVPVSARADKADVAKGKTLYAENSCADCHGENGREPLMTEYPVIAGQSEAYLYLALSAYKAHNRTGHGAGGHLEIFKTLTDADMHLLAKYIATMK